MTRKHGLCQDIIHCIEEIQALYKGVAVRVMDEKGHARQEINKPYDFFIKQLAASYTGDGRVSEARVLVLPHELDSL
jgi:hypothetical protein